MKRNILKTLLTLTTAAAMVLGGTAGVMAEEAVEAAAEAAEEAADAAENAAEDVFEIPWLKRLLELRDIERLDREIVVEMISEIKVYENHHISITYNFSNELENLFSGMYREEIKEKAM